MDKFLLARKPGDLGYLVYYGRGDGTDSVLLSQGRELFYLYDVGGDFFVLYR